MAKKPDKAAVIGLDCALPHLIERHIAEGHLPNLKKLIDGGVIADNCLAPFPTVTPPNWATIATGAWAGTHCVTDFHVHEPGTALDNMNIKAAFNSERVKAQFLWDMADQAGKRCLVVNYPGSWPSHMKNGIMLGGAGLSIGENRDGHWGLESSYDLCGEQLITTGIYPGSVKGVFQPARDWENLPESKAEPLEMDAELNFPNTDLQPVSTVWHVLAFQQGSEGYDAVLLSPDKNADHALCTLSLGEWSPKIFTAIPLADGSLREVAFRCKLLELDEDGEDFRLYLTAMIATDGWSSPPEIAKTIVSEQGVPVPGGGVRGLSVEWFDLDTYAELNELQDQWIGDAVVTLMKNHPWDLFYMHTHPPDWFYHIGISDMDPDSCPDEARRQKAWDIHLRIYQSTDRMVGRILEAAGDNTLIVTVSDHGATPDGPPFFPHEALETAGLVTMRDFEKETTGFDHNILKKFGVTRMPDASVSQAIPQRSYNIYINLKGRDPDGIVDPADYEAVQQRIIDALLGFRDPQTGQRPVALALTKRDARILHLHGDYIGDVVYALNPWFSSQHGPILPTAEWGVGSLKALLTFTGPGIKKGHRLERTVWLTDIVPTICYLLDFPVPEQTEGSVIYQVFKDPNFKLKELQKLKDGLARMETALERKTQEPWNKFVCA